MDCPPITVCAILRLVSGSLNPRVLLHHESLVPTGCISPVTRFRSDSFGVTIDLFGVRASSGVSITVRTLISSHDFSVLAATDTGFGVEAALRVGNSPVLDLGAS
jgi:hypothetical protein